MTKHCRRLLSLSSLALPLACLALACLVAPAANAADPDATVPDAWLLDSSGRVAGAYNVGGVEWTESAAASGGFVDVTLSGGGTATIQADLGQDSVIVNQSPQSYENTSVGRPPFSIVGLGSPLASPAPGAQTSVQIEVRDGSGVLPDPATSAETVQVVLQAVPRGVVNGSLTGLVLHWRINGGITETKDASEDPTHTIYFAANGVYAIEAWARQGPPGSTSVVETWTLTVAGADPLRDQDGDGLPDVFEAEFGFSPLGTDLDLDADGNGVADFIEILCTVHLAMPDATADTDGDEKTDCEETLRGTNLSDTQLLWPDVPVNGDFYEVEYLLDGQVWADEAQTTPELEMRRYFVATPGGSVRYDSNRVPTEDDLTAAGITEAQLPLYWRSGELKLDLGGGELPDGARIPAEQSLVVTAYEAGGSADEKWAARAWVGSTPPLTPAVVTPILVDDAVTWTTGSGWLTEYGSYLQAHIAETVVVDLSPTTGLGISLMESAAAYYAQLSAGAMIVFGEPDSPDVPDAVRAIQMAIGRKIDASDGSVISEGRSLDDLHAELLAIAQPGGLAATFAAAVAGYYADTASFTQRDTLRAAAALLQGDPGDDDPAARYLPRLLTKLSLAELQALPAPEYAALVDPTGDADGDGVPNEVELAAAPPVGSDPRLADTDGDGHTDDYDPCPASAGNGCLFAAYQTMDSDGDGVVDSIDNCIHVANADQADANDNGFGDACMRYAAIRRPSSGLRIFAGTTLQFEGEDSGELLHTPPLAYDWDFDGAAPSSTALSPGPITFSTPGTYQVSMTTTDAGGAGSSTPPDLRTIIVVLSAPLPTVGAGGPYAVVEGDLLVFSGSGVPGSGIIETWGWDFGDGNPGSGPAPSHSYLTEGAYTATLTVTDSGNNSASDDAAVTVLDSVPSASFLADPLVGKAPLVVSFDDLSTAYDGIASRTWVWKDGTPNGSAPNTTHRFTTPGIYEVELHVTDGDGSVSVASQTITVPGAVPALGPAGLALLAGLIAWVGAVVARRR